MIQNRLVRESEAQPDSFFFPVLQKAGKGAAGPAAGFPGRNLEL